MTLREQRVRTLAGLLTVAAIVACVDAAGPGARERSGAPQTVSTGRPDSGRTRSDTVGQPPDSGTPPDSIPPDSTPPDSTPPDSTPPDSTPTDTTHPPPPPIDTTSTDAILVGDVIGIDSTRNPARFAPLNGAAVTIFRQVTVSDSASDSLRVVWDSVATGRSQGQGRFDFSALRAGRYLVRAIPPSGSGYTIGYAQTIAYSRQALLLRAPVHVFVHRRP